MKLLRSARRLVCDSLVNLSPNLFLDSLRRNHYEVVAREFNRAHLFDWSKAKIPPRLEEFEDMVPLFALSPMSRGIIRQDFDEAAALFRAIKSLPEANGVEIGRFNGGSTVLLAAAIGNRGRLVSVDIAPQDDSTLARILKKTKLADRVELIVGDANQVQTDHKYDFVFIDGDHSYLGAKRDHNRWGAMVKPGGLIIHHDMADSRPFSTQWNDLARLRNDILAKQRKELKLVDEVGSLSIFKKRNQAWSDI
jgi:predicted O-methyltransferase YrrM